MSHLPHYAALVLVMFFWSSNVVVMRYATEMFNPVTLSAWRWVGALILLIPFSYEAFVRRREILADWRSILAMGTLGVAGFPTLLMIAVNFSTAINVALINTITPIVILVMSRFIFGTAITVVNAFGILLALLGAVTVVSRGSWQALVALQINPGDAIQLVAVFCWSTYSILLQRHVTTLKPTSFLFCLISAAMPALFIAYGIEALAVGNRAEISVPAMTTLGYLVVGPSVVAIILWNVMVPKVGASTAGMFNYLVPLFVAVMAYAFLNEPFGYHHLVGLLLILPGVALATRRRA